MKWFFLQGNLLTCNMVQKAAKNQPSKIILGIDPGTTVMGYGLIEVKGQEIKLIQFKLPPPKSPPCCSSGDALQHGQDRGYRWCCPQTALLYLRGNQVPLLCYVDGRFH